VFGRLVLTQNELQFRPRLALRNIFVPYANVLSVQRREDAATLAVEIKRRDGQVRELLFGDLQPHLSLPVGVSGGHSVGSAVVDALQQQHQAFVSTLGVGPSQEAVAQARVGAAELGHVLTHLVSAGADGIAPETVASIRWPVDQTAFRRLLLTIQRDGAASTTGRRDAAVAPRVPARRTRSHRGRPAARVARLHRVHRARRD
jgi:hypothetical protein